MRRIWRWKVTNVKMVYSPDKEQELAISICRRFLSLVLVEAKKECTQGENLFLKRRFLLWKMDELHSTCQ